MKNMKLTNLSLSVLIALGLVACGGSDNKDDAPVDKKPDTGHTDAGGGSDGTDMGKDTGPKKDVNGLEVPIDPRRASPKMSVEPNHNDITKVNKQLYIDRQSRDAVAGYNGWLVRQGDPTYTTVGGNSFGTNTLDASTQIMSPNEWSSMFGNISGNLPGQGSGNQITVRNSPASSQGGLAYNPGATKDQDILRNSIYNYFEEQSKQNSLNKDGGIHANPAFSYALGEDGNYYRVIPNNSSWDTLNGTSTFRIAIGSGSGDNAFGKYSNGTQIPMSEIVFIPNALGLTIDGTLANQGHQPATTEFSNPNAQEGVDRKIAGVNILNPKLLPFYDLNRGNVQYSSFELAGVKYDLIHDFNTNNIPLDLSKVEVKKEIQTKGIKLNYDIINDQATGTLNDDEVVSRSTEAGAMKLYNLPYSRSSITINQQAVADANHVNAAPNNMFNLARSGDGHYGAFQVVGFQTNSLPRDGRADYVGKSYGVNSEGDLHLTADFAINRAGIHGVVDNRKTVDGKRTLPSLTLQQIDLSNGTYEHTASVGMQNTSLAPNGTVTIGGRGVGNWAVALYGPNAEEVGGVIDLDGTVGPLSSSPSGLLNLIDGVSPDVLNTAGATPGLVVNPQYQNGKNFEVFSGQRGRIIDDSLNPGVGSAK